MDTNDTKLTAFEEKSFRLNVQSRMKEIAKEERPQSRESQYVDLLSYFEDGVAEDLRDKIQEGVDAARKEIEDLAEKGATFDEAVEESKKELTEKVEALLKEKESAESTLEEISDKFEKATELLDSMKVYSNKMKEMYDVAVAEKNGMITASEYKEALAYIESLEEEKEELIEKMNKIRERANRLQKDRRVDEYKKKKKKSEEEDDDEDDDDDEDGEESGEEKEVEESFPHVKPEILNYYEDLVYAQPAVKAIRSDILSAKTLIEAQRTYLRLKGLIFQEDHERRPPIKESTYFKPKAEKKITSSGPAIKIRDGWV